MIDKEKLVKDYYEKKTESLRTQMIEVYAPLVKVVAGRLAINMIEYFDYEDLCSFGVFGLIDAITKYTPELGTKFETYASLRIRGAILDEVRKYSLVPRSVVERKKLIENAYKNLSMSNKSISNVDVAKFLGISLKELTKWEYQIEQSKIVYIDKTTEGIDENSCEIILVSDTGVPEKEIIDKLSAEELKKILVEELGKLTEREKQVVLLYYYEELTLKEISMVLDVSESRVGQLHQKAIKKLKNNMKEYSYLFNCY